MDFVVFEAHTKILSLKISYKLATQLIYTVRASGWCSEHTVN